MPLTPLHLGPALLLGVLLYRRLDLPTLLVGSVIVDVRALLVVAGVLDGPTHGILTTFVGATAVALALAGTIVVLPDSVQSALDAGRLARTQTVPSIVGGALVGTYSHVVLDAMLYTDVHPFYPAAWNPFFVGSELEGALSAGCALAGLLGLGWIAYSRESVREVGRG